MSPTLPAQFIDKNGQLNILNDGEYRVAKDIPLLQFINTQDCDLAITQDGRLFHMILHYIIEVEQYRFKRIIFHDIGFLALTTCGRLLHLELDGNGEGYEVYSVNILLTNVNFIIESLLEWTSGIDLIVNFTSGHNTLYHIEEGIITKIRDLNDKHLPSWKNVISVDKNILIDEDGLYTFRNGRRTNYVPGIVTLIHNGDGDCIWMDKNGSVNGGMIDGTPTEKELLNIRGQLFLALRWKYFIHWGDKKKTVLYTKGSRLQPIEDSSI